MLAFFPLFSFATNGQIDSIDQTLRSMTIRQKVGQLLIFGYPGTAAQAPLKKLLQELQPGALITFGRNIQSLPQIAELNRQAQVWAKENSGIPLFIMVDQEGGNVARLKVRHSLPSALALGETNDPKLIESYGEAMGHLMAKIGFNVNLAPVLDLSDPKSVTFIGPRSFGRQPNNVGQIASAFSRGLAMAAVMPTAKHFPGHGGLAQDSHHMTPQKLATLDELSESDLVPFQNFCRSDYPRAIMMAHISFPQIDPSGTPSAFSPVFIQTVLRQKLHFDGLVITDDVEMSGANAAGSLEERVVRAIEAGNDMVMVAWDLKRQRRAAQAIFAALQSGRLSVARVDESVRRILEYKRRLDFNRNNLQVSVAAQNLGQLQTRLESLAEKIKRYNFMKTANSNIGLRGSFVGRSRLTVFSSDPRFFGNFRGRYGSHLRFIRLTPTALEELETQMLENPQTTFVYYASGAQTARWLNQLTGDVKKRIIVVNTIEPGAIDNKQTYMGVFQINTQAPESGRWLAEFLTDPPSPRVRPFTISEK